MTRENSGGSNNSVSDYEFHIVEDDDEDDKVAEIEIGSDIPIRRDSPLCLNVYKDAESKRGPAFLQCSGEKSTARLAGKLLNIENIVKEEKDDKIAEILKAVEKLKHLLHPSELGDLDGTSMWFQGRKGSGEIGAKSIQNVDGKTQHSRLFRQARLQFVRRKDPADVLRSRVASLRRVLSDTRRFSIGARNTTMCKYLVILLKHKSLLYHEAICAESL